MQLSSVFLAVVAAISAFAQAPDPAINTPSGVQQCLPVQLTFSGTSPPFIITIVPAGQPGAAPLTTVGTTSANAITWNANLPAGASYNCVIRDSMGRTNPSGPFTINPGDSSCLNGSSAAAGSSAAGSSAAPATSQAPATSVVATTTAVPQTTTVAANGSSSVVTTSKASTASVVASPSATATKNAGSAAQPMGIAGLVGLVGAAALF
ncbi:hypothetical protein FRB90_003401 [Tulasnella sp. 427]|nr:hypothetical protein FRB90_003401 [Tulasnella sp. 427]